MTPELTLPGVLRRGAPELLVWAPSLVDLLARPIHRLLTSPLPETLQLPNFLQEQSNHVQIYLLDRPSLLQSLGLFHLGDNLSEEAQGH